MLNETSSVEKLINQYAQAEAQAMTESLRSHALDRGWAPNVADDINVKYANGNLSVNLTDAMDDAEYGNGPQTPKAALRTFSKQSDVHLANILNPDVIDEFIMSSGAFNG